jgi:DNA-binding transcriptional LysR family regulator
MHAICDILAAGDLSPRIFPDVKNIDLKLLAIISELHHTRSVSQTADNLAISQSAVSMCLAKLRKHFNDPLFVRTSVGMEPTPHAAELIQLLKRAEDLLQSALGHHVVFNPVQSNRVFRLHSTDIAQVTLIPKLMGHLREVAPSVRVELGRISESTPRLLESGAADLAVGFILPMGAGFCHQSLFKEKFVCAVRRNHPRIGDTLSLEQFQNGVHLAISTSGTGHGIVERTLETKGIKREVGLTVPSFLGIASVLASTDYLVTLPGQLAEHMAGFGNIKVLRLPFQLPSYVIMQHWHERYTHDPATRWLRSVMVELFSEGKALSQRKFEVVSSTRQAERNNSPDQTKILINQHIAR